MVLGKSIYDINGKLLLKEGGILSSKIKFNISERGYNYIFIKEEGTEDVIPEDIISDHIRMLATMKLTDKTEEISRCLNFQNISHDKAVKLIEDGQLKKVDITTDMKNITAEIIKDISAASVKTLNTLLLKSQDSYFMDHAINTTVLSILIAKKYNLNSEEISALALGTFLHDIGKVVIEQLQDHDNPQKAKEYYFQHPKFGYELLRNSHNVSLATQIVYQHHEYQNGSGFPRGLIGDNNQPIKLPDRNKKERIFRLAEICCVANAYDKMVLNPSIDKQMDPQDVLIQMIKDSGTKYNKNIVQTLFQVVPAFQIGLCVKIVDASEPTLVNYTGVVSKINETTPNKPEIIIIRDKFNKKIKPRHLDTSELYYVKLKILL